MDHSSELLCLLEELRTAFTIKGAAESTLSGGRSGVSLVASLRGLIYVTLLPKQTVQLHVVPGPQKPATIPISFS